jgi:hypothetical protein
MAVCSMTLYWLHVTYRAQHNISLLAQSCHIKRIYYDLGFFVSNFFIFAVLVPIEATAFIKKKNIYHLGCLVSDGVIIRTPKPARGLTQFFESYSS